MSKFNPMDRQPSKKGAVLNILGGLVMLIMGIVYGLPEMGLGFGLIWIAIFAFYTVYQILILIGLIKMDRDNQSGGE